MSKEGLFFGGLAAFILGGFFLFMWASIEERRQWEAFKTAHECRVVGKKSAQVFNTVGPVINTNGTVGVGVGVGSTSPQTAWLCNDGVTYWRNG